LNTKNPEKYKFLIISYQKSVVLKIQLPNTLTESKTIPIMETFDTLQGEGYHTGSAAFFIRTGGCDVGCVWCDVKESWDAGLHPDATVAQIIDKVNKSAASIVVVTGGEPLMYNLDLLTSSIQAIEKRTHIETAGVYPITGIWNWICFSPKKFKAPLEDFYQLSNELKIVIYHSSDFKWAEGHAQKMNPNAKLYLQPEWSKRSVIMPQIIDYVKHNPNWRVSLQTHKYLDIP